MSSLEETAPAFVEMAHRIVWASVATLDTHDRPRSRILHPIWEWDDGQLVGWLGTSPTPLKLAHIDRTPYVSVNYWSPDHDTCTAECKVTWIRDDDGRTAVWERLKNGPEPVGYDPAIIQPWAEGPTGPAFAAWRLDPWRLRVFPGSIMTGGGGSLLEWGA